MKLEIVYEGGKIMYIIETTESVRKLFEKLDGIDCIHKMRFILYVFD